MLIKGNRAILAPGTFNCVKADNQSLKDRQERPIVGQNNIVHSPLKVQFHNR
jgi:hypothetical protein